MTVRAVTAQRAPIWLIVLAAVAASAAAIPIVYLVVRTLDAGADQFIATLLRPRVAMLTLNSVLLAVAVTASCLVLGTATAWLLTRWKLRGERLWLLVSALPLAVPSYLAAYGWLVWMPSLHGFWPSWLVMTAVCVPLVTLPVAAALRGASADLEAVARTLGRGPFGAFRVAIWPQIRTAAIAGALLVSLYTLSEFGSVSMLRYQTLTWGINAAYGASFDRNQAALLALVLVALALIVVWGERRARGRVISRPARPLPRQRMPRVLALPAFAIVLAAPIVGVLVPVAGLGVRLAAAETLRELDLPRLFGAIGATLGFAAGGALLAVLLALPIAGLASRYRGRLVSAIEAFGYLGHALPGIVVGLALVFFGLGVVPVLYQSAFLLVFAYAVLYMPKAIGTARSGMAVVPQQYLEVSRTLGVRPIATWTRVTMRLALPGVAVGALLVAIAIMKELPATLLLRPTGVNTLATELWDRTATFEFGAAAPFAAALVLVAAIPAVALSGIRGSARENEL